MHEPMSTPELQLELYRQMLRIRLFEEMALYQSSQGKVHGTLHLCVGQEASAVGVCAALARDDYVASTHRGHGHCLAKGAAMDRMMAELYGRATGYCGGKGGSMHIADFACGMLGANGIVAAGLALAAGACLSSRMAGGNRVGAAFFGDGATTRGPFHEVLNLAALWKLPVLFVCENNGYAQWVHQRENLAAENVADFAAAYRMPGVTVDGNDVQAVYAAAREAVARGRAGEGPTLIECRTYRIHGHSLGDMNVYRGRDEVDAWRSPGRDPLLRHEAWLREHGLVDDRALAGIRADSEAEVAAAVEFAEHAPWPAPDALHCDVFAD